MSASTGSFSAEVERLAEAIDAAEAVCVGAGAGLSTAAGLSYSGERFERHFAAWRERYGFADMYSGGFHPYDTLEDSWGFWARMALANRYGSEGPGDAETCRPTPAPLYVRLMELLAGRNHFVLTTNVDHQFQLADIERERLFYTQGDYGLFQCSGPCHAKTYDNEAQVRAMGVAVDEKLACQTRSRLPARLFDLSVPSELVPRCPVCGRPMTMNLRCDATFVEDEGWHAASRRYHDFLRETRRTRVLYLELGVGFNTPGIIKYPFWRRAAENPRAIFASVNKGEVVAPRELAEAGRAILIDADIAEVLGEL